MRRLNCHGWDTETNSMERIGALLAEMCPSKQKLFD